MASTAQSLMTQAVGLGYDALSNRQLKECLLVAAQSGGGGGGGGNPAPGVVNPNGNVSAAPGAEYFNTANSTFWVQASAVTGNTGWVQLILLMMMLMIVCPKGRAQLPISVRSTNGTAIGLTASGAFSGDGSGLTNLFSGNIANNANIVPAGAVYNATLDMANNGVQGDPAFALNGVSGQVYVFQWGSNPANDDVGVQYYCTSTSTPGYQFTIGTNLYGFMSLGGINSIPSLFTNIGTVGGVFYISGANTTTIETQVFPAVNTYSGNFNGSFAGNFTGNGTLNLSSNSTVPAKTLTGAITASLINTHPNTLVSSGSVTVSASVGTSLWTITAGTIPNLGIGQQFIVNLNHQFNVSMVVDSTHFWTTSAADANYVSAAAVLNPPPGFYRDTTDTYIAGSLDAGGSTHASANGQISGYFLHDQFYGKNNGWTLSTSTFNGFPAFALYNWTNSTSPFQIGAACLFNSLTVDPGTGTDIRYPLENPFGDLVLGGTNSSTTNLQVQLFIRGNSELLTNNLNASQGNFNQLVMTNSASAGAVITEDANGRFIPSQTPNLSSVGATTGSFTTLNSSGTTTLNVLNTTSIVVGASTNVSSFTLVNTNWVSGKLNTNNTGRIIHVICPCQITMTGVSGAANFSLVSAGNTTNALAQSTLITSLATSLTNEVSGYIAIGGVFTFTNLSTGTGDSGGPVNGGQYMVF